MRACVTDYDSLQGRSTDKVTYSLHHPSISRLHALIVHHQRLQAFFLIDCGSAHGTYLAGKRIEPKVSQLPCSPCALAHDLQSRAFVLACVPFKRTDDHLACRCLSALQRVQDPQSLYTLAAHLESMCFRFLAPFISSRPIAVCPVSFALLQSARPMYKRLHTTRLRSCA